jgi:hypothetical protein
MKLYTIRKRRGQWAVCSDENVVLRFDSYDEAIGTVRSAVQVLSNKRPVNDTSAVVRSEDASTVPCPFLLSRTLPHGSFRRRSFS